jgi:glycosyltransferase involved in cell wall biosynthesis
VRALFLQRQPCIRALKYAVGLRAILPKIRLGFVFQGRTLSEWYGSGDEAFDRWWRLDGDTATGLGSAISEFRPDLIHSHNLPDSLTVAALAVVNGGIPVIHDVHDLQSLRRTPYEDGFPEPADPLGLEKQAVEGSAAVVAVSDDLLAAIGARHALAARTLAFPNYALRCNLPAVLPATERLRSGRAALVYQGTLGTNGGHYDLRALFSSIVAQEVRLDVYPARPAPVYRRLAGLRPGLRLQATVNPKQLLQILPRYDFGWAGFNDSLNRAHLDTALPNKVFEYLGCGLPVVTLGHKAIKRLVEAEGVGVALSTLESLGDQLAGLDLPALRRRVAAARLSYTVEANIERVAELYESVIA